MLFSRAALAAILLFTVTAPTFTFVNADTGAAFSYDPEAANGPANWGKLEIDGNQCGEKSNSPIAVYTRACDRWGNYEFQPGTCTFNDMFYELTNTGVKASFPATCENPKVKIPGLDGLYQALQFHIHTSSEHTINNEFFGAELHIVHQKVDGDRYAVVGMMIDPTADEPNENFGTLLSEWGSVFANQDAGCAIQRSGRERQRQRVMLQEPQDPRELQGTGVFNPYALLPEGVTYYYYDGGLTTPPCSQVVWWNLADAPVKITPGQYWQLTNQILNFVDPSTCQLATNAGPAGSTSRPVQPLNGRSVERVCPAGFGVGTDEAVTKCEDVDPPVTTLPIPDVPVPSSVDDEEVTEDGASHMGLLGAVAVMAATLFL